MFHKHLLKARDIKRDEFYTQYEDIQKEISYYINYNPDIFRNKVIYCNCDNPFDSNFFKYFVNNFKNYGIKKIITSNYIHSPNSTSHLYSFITQKNNITKKHSYAIEINDTSILKNNTIHNTQDIIALLQDSRNSVLILYGDKNYDAGDFRSSECIELMKQSDIIITNPPFSLFKEFIYQITKYQKQFLVLGNISAVTYPEIFPLIQKNKIWLGASIHSGDVEFKIPNDYKIETKNYRFDSEGNKYVRVPSIRWFTNLEYGERYKLLKLHKKYNPLEYPKYDNYDAIEVSKTSNIPIDYKGIMGVPLTFLDKYNPNQFEIVGKTHNKIHAGKYLIGDNPYVRLNGKRLYYRILIKHKYFD